METARDEGATRGRPGARIWQIVGLKLVGMVLAGVMMALLMVLTGRHGEAGPYASAFWTIVEGIAAVVIPVGLRLRRDHSPRAWLVVSTLGGALFGALFVAVMAIGPSAPLLPPRPADPVGALNFSLLADLPGALLTALLFGAFWGLLYAQIGMRATRREYATEFAA